MKKLSVILLVLTVTLCTFTGCLFPLPTFNPQTSEAPDNTPGNVPEGYDAAHVLLVERKYSEAADAFTALITDNPQSDICLLGRGDSYAGLYMAAEANSDYKSALEIAKTARAYMGVANTEIMLGDIDAAKEIIDEGVEQLGTDDLKRKQSALAKGNYTDGTGRVYKRTSYDSEGDLRWYHIFEYGNDGLCDKATSYDKYDVVTAEYACTQTASGKQLLDIWYFPNDGMFSRREYVYDDNELLVQIIGHGNENVATNKSLYTYDENGVRIENKYYANIERDTYTITKYYWTDFGKIDYTTATDQDGNHVRRVVYEYDDLHLNTKMTYYDADDNLDFYYTYEYDEAGYQRVQYTYEADGTLKSTTYY